MKKKLNLLITAAIMSVSISCSDNIDLLPSDTIPTETAIQNYEDFDRAVIGVYSNIGYNQTIYSNTLMADESRWAIDNNVRNYGLPHKWAFDSSDGNVTAPWGNLYNVIDRINRALAVYDNLTTMGTQAQELPRLRGELLALRALCHFDLLRSFASGYENDAMGVPLMLESVVLGKPPRNTFGEVINQVKLDLAEADQLIPAGFGDLFRITKPAVVALRARVALYAKDWDEAITFSNQAIGFKGQLSSGDSYIDIWNDSNTSETFFQLRRNSNGGSIRTLWTDDNTDVFFSPSFKLIDSYDGDNDVRYNAFILDDESVEETRENWKVNKYPGQNETNRFNNIKVIRVSEVYLILAEAYAENNNLADATKALNDLRSARIDNYSDETFANKQDVIDAIYLERFKELAFEGHRFFDLKRRNLIVERDDRDLAFGAAIPKILMTTDRNYLLPIPSGEIYANENIIQNPGYVGQ
ncbi:RagB/SusD family nutrient uptake outer membrane protein [Parapedobacter tibetensis]|uniref:RagB/SusD family nutrient uptake outer membrane protein n=1 Tax=Parapedobacter tibetensis TaxID=2972951 RepID=UPI00214D410D|nr:RagB/SusD family nutrient uptake outer membrane protein [Parapedobacter tibetensis]